MRLALPARLLLQKHRDFSRLGKWDVTQSRREVAGYRSPAPAPRSQRLTR